MKSTAIFVVAILIQLGLTGKIRAANLVSNGDFSQGNTGFTTQYNYVTTGYSASPLTYAVRSSSTSFNPALDYFADHSTGSGLMMVVDGGSGQQVVWAQTVTVQPNTDYRFAAWFVATHLSKAARIQYKVNGAPIGSPYDIPQGSGIWSEYSVGWNSGAATTAVLQIVDLQTDNSVPGNDFAIDDISFADGLGGGGPLTASIAMYAGIEITGTIGSAYRVEYSDDLAATTWTHLGTLVLTSSPYVVYDRDSKNRQKRFYRVVPQ